MLRELLEKVNEEVRESIRLESYESFKKKIKDSLKMYKDLIEDDYNNWKSITPSEDCSEIFKSLEEGSFKIKGEEKDFKEYFTANKKFLLNGLNRILYLDLLLLNYDIHDVEESKREFAYLVYKDDDDVDNFILFRKNEESFNKLINALNKEERKKPSPRLYM